ncbi:M12 family metallo-peptidase, partial [Persicitalea sp.]|uniref:M12 family metallo-peptidase n=1 Tax=Persicitalea sp. TaxID=3100273 RepID=UPI003593E19F
AVVTNAVKSSVQGNSTARTTAEGCRKVGIYMEADYTLYQNWGSDVAHITNQIAAIFNNVATLYANEGVTIELSELKIWDTQDPYFSATNRGELLAQFKDYWNSRGNTFNGDMAHLLSSRINGGGVAYNGVPRRNTSYSIDDFASVFSSPVSRQFAFGVSTGIADGPVPPLPEYSYRTYLIAHELGHNFGLPHSHSCFWHGGPIDNCATTENGPCPAGPSPANGGTIMSYCPNLANGFGPQPSAKLKYEFITGQNLMHPGSNPPGISLSQSTVMKGQSVEISVSNCSGSVSWDDGVVTGNIRRIIARAPTRYTAICGADGCLSASAEVFLNTVCVQPTACTVSYSAILNHIHGIHLFSLGTISTNDINATPINVGSSYQDLTCTQHTVLKAGDSYPFNLTSIYDFELNARIYIDYNGDGVFSDTNELVYSGGNASQHNGNISIPNSALRNTPLRMRVLMNALPISSACSLPSNGQYRSGKANDYAVTIAAPTCPPNQRETVQSGDWNDPLVWSCGTLPAFSDIVKINTGHFISLPPAYTGNVLGFELLGTIQYGVNATIRLNQP